MEGEREEERKAGHPTHTHTPMIKLKEWHCLFSESFVKNPLLKSSKNLHVRRFT